MNSRTHIASRIKAIGTPIRPGMALAAALVLAMIGVPQGPQGDLTGISTAFGAEMSDLTLSPTDTLRLKPAVEVQGDYVLLGDLFTGPVPKADTPVAHAPAPGRSATYDAEWLNRVARAYDLDWRPTNSLLRVMISRPGDPVAAQIIKDTIKNTLVAIGAPEHSTVIFSGGIPALTVPKGAFPVLHVTSQRYDAATRRFAMTIDVTVEDSRPQTVRVAGRLDPTETVPVLARQVDRNDIIRATDLRMKPMSARSLPNDVVSDPRDIIGMAARKLLSDGKPVRRLDIKRPILVEKGALVTLTLTIPGLELTAQGQAMEAGSNGDTVRIMNTASNKIVLATITGPGTVAIRPSNQVAAR